ncbi:hypothetical protein PG984_007714 [Apiospora sp. TS-2023a]
MASIHDLPWELMHVVVGHLDDVNDIVSLARARSDLYEPVMNDICAPTQCRILLWACTTGATRVVNRILNAGLSPKFYFRHDLGRYERDYDPEFYFTSPQLIDALSSEVDTEEPIVSFWQPLHVAVRHGHSDIVRILLDKHAWVDAPSMRFSHIERPLVERYRGENTPLHLAICEGYENIARTLITNGASVHVDHSIQTQMLRLYPERSRMSAFHLCAFKGLVSTAELLIDMEYGTAVNELDEYGCSPLMYAYHFKQDDFLHFLLAQGASPRINQSVSCSVYFRCRKLLHQACWDNRWDLVAKLDKHSADSLEPDSESEGLQLLYFCVDNFKPLLGWDPRESELKPEDEVELQKMVSTIESSRMHIGVNRETLDSVINIAVKRGLYLVVSLLLDTGLATGTMIKNNTMIEGGRPFEKPWRLDRYHTESEPTTFDPNYYYNQTGANETCLPMLDFACYTFEHTRNAQKTIGVLLAKGCIGSGELGCCVRALKNLCCHVFNAYSIFDEDQPILRHCVQAICSQLSDTPETDSQKPKMPIDLLYVCINLGQDVILDEMAKVFEIDYAVYSETEIWRLFDAIKTSEMSTGKRVASCVKILLREDTNSRLLQHSRTFETLCGVFLGRYICESAILNYLDRGGCYSLTFKNGRTALCAATSSGCVKLAEKLLDMGADPNKFLTRSIFHIWEQDFFYREARNPAFMRLLIKRGFNPLILTEDNPGLRCLFAECLQKRGSEYEEFELFQELCHTINENTDDGDLFYLLDTACSRGQYRYIQELRLHAKDRVDAVIREKAALFLQKLLVNISPASNHRILSNNSTIMEMDNIIDTMGLILQLGPRNTLISSWRLKEGREDFTALKILQKLLMPQSSLDISDTRKYEYQQRYRVYWCLNERVKIDLDSGKLIVTILGKRIEWPEEFNGAVESFGYLEEINGTFAGIPTPWDYYGGWRDEE